MSDDLAKFLKAITIINNDGSERKMDDEEAENFASLLSDIGDQMEEEQPRMEAVIERLNAKVDGLELTYLGGAVPIQADGFYKGEPLYFRSRYSHASLSIGSTDEKPPSSWNPRLYAIVRVTEPGDDFGAGWLAPEEVEVVIPILIDNLEEQTPEENQERLDGFVAQVNETVEAMKKTRDAE